MTGTFHVVSLSQWRSVMHIATRIFSVRYAKNKPADWIYTDVLSPSKQLFSDVQVLKDKGEWNEEKFQSFYVPRFREEMSKPKPQKYLNRIAEILDSGEDVVFACYCGKDKTMCHRHVISALIEERGYPVDRH